MKNGQKYKSSFISRFSPKSGPGPGTVQQGWTVETPGKKHSISSQTTRNEVLCMLTGNQRSPPFPLSFFLNLLALPEASLSLKMAMLGQQQYCQSCSGYPKSEGKFFTLARGMGNWALAFPTVLGWVKGFFLSIFFSFLSFLYRKDTLHYTNCIENQDSESKPRFWARKQLS